MTADKMLHPSFNAHPDESCPCDSGQLLRDCCGRAGVIPKNIILEHEAIDARKCEQLVSYYETRKKHWLQVNQTTLEGGKYVRDEQRITQTVDQGKYQKTIDKLIETHLTRILSKHFQKTLYWYERPHVLYYMAGGKYDVHADAENHNTLVDSWIKARDRDYSILVYLTDDFEGGELLFNRFGFRYKPKRGDLVVFPSDNRYLHTAEPVTSGHRYAIVSWCSVAESERKFEMPANARLVAR